MCVHIYISIVHTHAHIHTLIVQLWGLRGNQERKYLYNGPNAARKRRLG